MTRQQISAMALGTLTIAIGAVGILAGLGLMPAGPSDPTVPMAQQRAVAIAIGATFAAGGAGAIASTFVGPAPKIAKGVFGFIAALGLTSLFAWIALGPGGRNISGPTIIFGGRINEICGRIAFGFATLLGLLILVFMIRDAWRSRAKAGGAP
ncbi:MAG: hypothetical protein JO303_03595 [Caulobacteraceae bacterium]|nr:hypothetical protein [Caulobacteraceae bacterium]